MEIERLRSECVNCLLNLHLNSYPKDTGEAKKLDFMQRVLKTISETPKTISAPVVVREIADIRKEMFGVTDLYADIKQHFNEVMLSYEEPVQQKLLSAEDPLKLAIQYAMVGNYIDFGAMKNVDETYLTELFDSAGSREVNEDRYQDLKQDLEQARKLVYLTDNCGEIVMDKLLIRTLQRLYPELDITVIVRGSEILNDATMDDARQVGLTEIVRVMGNGNNVAGTYEPELSPEAAAEIASADILLAKGQGNYETLMGCGLNVYYMFLCKCDMFANLFAVPRFTGMLLNDRKDFKL